jgi:hypothetical protein
MERIPLITGATGIDVTAGKRFGRERKIALENSFPENRARQSKL